MTPPLRRLPMALRPRLGESTDSYILRLARANHLTPSYLHGFLCGPPNWFGKPQLPRLAALTGHTSEALQHALADASSPRGRRKPAPALITWPRSRVGQLRNLREEAAHGTPLPLLQRHHGVSSRTLRLLLTQDVPPSRTPTKSPARVPPHVEVLIASMADQGCRPRQIWTRLMNEYDVTVSQSTIRLRLKAQDS
ncbi:TniQ family protein [Streptomyces sp. NPDC050704]|uniref:TniQ family protein n=1 Tax=Streptomyces sp. NPDC050704 TaxID=3157219 RepID=UPI0034261909